MAAKSMTFPWQDKISNPAQLASIETSILDDGPGRGMRIAWFNTGSPLRYKIAIDRGMDIVDAFFGEHSLAWLSHGGLTAARPDAASHALEWLYSFSGGLVATCGLTHIGVPETDENETRGLHGRIGNIAATIESIVQPDPVNGKLDMSITALMKQSRVFGPNLQLRRTISGTLGHAVIGIRDVVTNCGNAPAPHMLLYHINCGWPLVDEDTEILWKGSWNVDGRAIRQQPIDRQIFNDKNNFHRCPAPLEKHRAGGEACAFIDVAADSKGMCNVGLYNKKLDMVFALTYKKKQLPAFANWQHWAPGEYVTGLEPGTNPPIGQNGARQRKQLIHIPPGKSKTYELQMSVLTGKKLISDFVKAAT